LKNRRRVSISSERIRNTLDDSAFFFLTTFIKHDENVRLFLTVAPAE
jgi:hypothetical protein